MSFTHLLLQLLINIADPETPIVIWIDSRTEKLILVVSILSKLCLHQQFVHGPFAKGIANDAVDGCHKWRALEIDGLTLALARIQLQPHHI